MAHNFLIKIFLLLVKSDFSTMLDLKRLLLGLYNKGLHGDGVVVLHFLLANDLDNKD